MTVEELRDALDVAIEAGYGEWKVKVPYSNRLDGSVWCAEVKQADVIAGDEDGPFLRVSF